MGWSLTQINLYVTSPWPMHFGGNQEKSAYSYRDGKAADLQECKPVYRSRAFDSSQRRWHCSCTTSGAVILEAVLMWRLGRCGKAATRGVRCCGASLGGIPC